MSSSRTRPHHRAELGRDALLADEERAQPVHPHVALVLVDPLVPVDPILGEVQVLHRPLLALPERVQLAVVQQLGPRVGGHLEPRIARRAKVGALPEALGARC